ncbi:MAG: hypothetical protein H8D42_03875 [Candidatus Marinimicrobia bacterium]|nr:hypothetical protein [Candidatus Neomarinimicrobiota bacterium]
MSGLNGAEFALLIMSSVGILAGIAGGFILLFRYINTRNLQVRSQEGTVSARMVNAFDGEIDEEFNTYVKSYMEQIESSSKALHVSSRILQKYLEELKTRHKTTQ